jgi:mono-ADP-ribosyltransferase sirtuin 6
MSLVQLEKRGLVKFLISQNCDGLHRRSGFSQEKIAELHGNSNIEVCSSCGKEYLRDYKAVAPYAHSVHDHRTARNCVLCNGPLVDTIINFGENLPSNEIEAGYQNAEKADLCLVLGSSLTVRPACDMPGLVGKNPYAKLVICNLQKTPLDDFAAIKIYSKCDDLMKFVMKSLNIEIPPFILHRRVKTNRKPNEVTIQALDFDGTPATIFSSVCSGNTELTNDPFIINSPINDVTLNFFGHYNEPSLNLQVHKDLSERYYDLHYNPLTGVWNIEDKGTSVEFFKVPKRQLTNIQKIPADISQTKPPVSLPSGGFSVNPKTNCPHFSSQVTLGVHQKVPTAFRANACAKCNDKSENWLCLNCGETFCSRYINEDAFKHFKESGHSVSISFSDLSIWCYSCDDYITHENLQSFVQTLSLTKFS